jgi:hypothetical protein
MTDELAHPLNNVSLYFLAWQGNTVAGKASNPAASISDQEKRAN